MVFIGVIKEIGCTDAFVLLLGFDYLVTENRKDRHRLDIGAIEKHGQANGMLWIAVRKPILAGEILTNVSSTDLFLTWVSQKLILQKLSAFKKFLKINNRR